MSHLQEDTSLKGRGDECFVLFLKCWCDTDEGWGVGGGRRIASRHTKLQNLFLFFYWFVFWLTLCFNLFFLQIVLLSVTLPHFHPTIVVFLIFLKRIKNYTLFLKTLFIIFLLGQVDCNYFAIKIGKGEMPFFRHFQSLKTSIAKIDKQIFF